MNRLSDSPTQDPAAGTGTIARWGLLLPAVLLAAAYNYSLIVDPMGWLVDGGRAPPSGSGHAYIAAAVIVVLELLLGFFFLEGRRITTLLPVFQALQPGDRIRIQAFCLFLLLMFGGIGTGLVLMSDLLATETNPASNDAESAHWKLAAEMGFAFVLPFLQILGPLSAERVLRARHARPR